MNLFIFSSNEEIFGELSSSGRCEGTVVGAQRYPHDLTICENFVGESMNGFVMLKTGNNSIIGKNRNGMSDGPVFTSGNDGMIMFTIYDHNVVSGPEMVLKPNCFLIRFENGNRLIQLVYENSKLIYGVVDSNNVLNYKSQ